MAQLGWFGLSVPSHPIRDLRGPSGPIRTRFRGRGATNPADRGGPQVCPRRLVGRLQDRDLPRGRKSARAPSEETRRHYLLRLHGMERGGRQAQGPLRDQSRQAIFPMEARMGADGDVVRVRHECPAQGSLPVAGNLEGIPAHTAAPGDEGLVHIQVRRTLLSLCGASIWVGQVPSVVYAVYNPVRARASSLGGIACSRISTTS